jgi:4-hydroxy-4-methyl-2-oxoglutarate aldolase
MAVINNSLAVAGKVFKAPERKLTGLLDAARKLDVATIAAALPEPYGRAGVVPAMTLFRVSGRGTVAGHAITVWQAPGNNSMTRYGIMSAGPADIVVVVCPTPTNAAQWGELASMSAQYRGIEAAIIDGAVRDIERATEIGFPIWARNIDPRQALKSDFGYVNGPVSVCGVMVNPGDLVVADTDGVLFLSPELAVIAIVLGTRRAEQEDKGRDARRQGKPIPAEFDTSRIQMLNVTWEEYMSVGGAAGRTLPD